MLILLLLLVVLKYCVIVFVLLDITQTASGIVFVAIYCVVVVVGVVDVVLVVVVVLVIFVMSDSYNEEIMSPHVLVVVIESIGNVAVEIVVQRYNGLRGSCLDGIKLSMKGWLNIVGINPSTKGWQNIIVVEIVGKVVVVTILSIKPPMKGW